jgi:hypothetical protein
MSAVAALAKEGDKMKHLALLFLLALAGCFAYPQDQQTLTKAAAKKFDFKARTTWYIERTYTDFWPQANLVGGVAVDDFVLGDEKRWGNGMPGFGKALAPAYGQRVINNTTEFFLGALIGDDARYRSSEKRGLIKRSMHATLGAFTARTESGKTHPAYSRIIAITTGTLISNRWRSDPKTDYDLTDALVFGVTDKIQDDLAQEFSPDLKRFGRKAWRKIRHH